MAISAHTFSRLLAHAATVWLEHTVELSDIDSRFGDGDHGVTVGKIASLMLDRIRSPESVLIGPLLAGLAEGIMAIGGGSAGPLYGTFFEGMAGAVGDSVEVDAVVVKRMFAGALASLSEISTAGVGDKTMFDAIIPAVEAAEKCDGDVGDVLHAAAQAARAGAEASRYHIARFGRAKSYGDKTLGTPDVGALSAALFFEGLDAVQEVS